MAICNPQGPVSGKQFQQSETRFQSVADGQLSRKRALIVKFCNRPVDFTGFRRHESTTIGADLASSYRSLASDRSWPKEKVTNVR